ncbi:MAG TPA: magnesium and cobalt transport protein CorA [Gaiellaceae bacterium]|nr:magnesium and cobalt transport protein CorA [Gaiellaceae bacterium]
MIVDSAVYVNGHRYAGDIALEETYEASRKQGCFAWIGLHEPTEDEFDAVRREFGLHELAVEDAIKAHQRPKLEVYGDTLFIVLKTARLADDDLVLGEILAFAGDGFIITVRHGDTELHRVRLTLEGRPDLLAHGPTAALYGIVDKVADDYLPLIQELDARVQRLEQEVFSPSHPDASARIYRLKRTVLEVHQAVAPLEAPVDGLASGLYPVVPEPMRPYFRDVHDHLLREIGRVLELRELLTSILTANMTQASFRQNEDVRKISAWAAIIAVPTAIAGIYGMNFDHMPELGWRFGYPLVLAVIAGVCLMLYWRFRRAGWL